MLNPLRQHHTFLEFDDLDNYAFNEVSLFDDGQLDELWKNRTLRDGSKVVGVHCYLVDIYEDSLFTIVLTDRGPYLEIQNQLYIKPLEELEAILLDFLLAEGYWVGGGKLDLDSGEDWYEGRLKGLLYFLIHAHGLALHPEDRIADSTLADELEPDLIESLDENLAAAIRHHGIEHVLELTAQIRPDLSPSA